MRIISGSARGKRLATFAGQAIRPTSDRVREAIFSILFSRLGAFEGKTVLDLFAGTGAMALEALSRGAARAVLVDQDPQAARLIAYNLKSCGLEERATLVRGDVLRVLPRLTEGRFDLIFLDPPYRRGLAAEAIGAIAAQGLLAPDGILCAESESREEIPDSAGNLVREERRPYGSTAVHLFIHSPETPGP